MRNQESNKIESAVIVGERDDAVLRGWQEVYNEYRPLLKPNKKPAAGVLDYLQKKYHMAVFDSERAREVARLNFTENLKHSKTGGPPHEFKIVVYGVENSGGGAELYRTQQHDFIESTAEWRKICKDAEDIPSEDFPFPILVNFDMNSGLVYVEGSPRLSDEIEVFQGHSEEELENTYIVARYVKLLKSANLL